MAQASPRGTVGLELEEVWSFRAGGSFGGFMGVQDAVELADGRIWVLDGAASQVVELSDRGMFQRVAATEGDGPGEVRGPHLAARSPADSLFLFDSSRHTVEVFAPEGSFLRRIRLDGPDTTFPKGFVVLPDGDLLLNAGLRNRTGGNPHSIHRFSPEGDLLQS